VLPGLSLIPTLLTAAPRGINDSYLKEEIPRQVSNSLSEVESFGSGLADALASGQLPFDALPEYLEQYKSYTQDMEDQILDSINHVILDKDQYFSQRVALLGKAIITIGMLDAKDPYVTDELRVSASRFALQNVTQKGKVLSQADDIRPSIGPISSQALALGFPRVYIDEDGVRRQIDLIYQWEDQYFPQLGFAVVVDLLQPQSFEITKKGITLKNINHPTEGPMEEFFIPLTRTGRMMINWPHAKFLDSFRHLSFLKLLVHDIYYKNLMENLEQLKSWGVLDMYTGENPLEYLYYAQDYFDQALSGDTTLTGEEYRQIRDAAFTAVQTMTNSALEQDAAAEISFYLQDPNFPEDQKETLSAMLNALPVLMDSLDEISAEILKLRGEIFADLQNSLIVLGYTGESTQDIGVTPFENRYMNMGLHGAVINTILQEDYMDNWPLWISILISLGFTALLILVMRSGNTWQSMGAAVGVWIFGLVGLFLVFRFTGIYPGLLMPLLSAALTSLILLILKFITENQEKGFIKNAFGQYLSSDVIDNIINDPSQLSLGGAEKELTAIFTDVKGFSTISEQLTPPQLVTLLNTYLTAFSDIILDHNGTIDKFEGDAIIAFFGAPHDLKNHALAAILSTLEMKKVEKILNKDFLSGENPLSPSPLLTRIGVNSGPMVVGNMGTTRKMDYTIMGNAVNLAARLEGVNKEYNTWTLCSHFTYERVKYDVVARPLDRVRVVGIHEPVQLYNLIEEKAFATNEMMEQLELFNQAMDLFNSRKWEDAEKAFAMYFEIFKDDLTAQVYLNRCQTYMKKPPSENWDGVYNLTNK
jgi:adenylate cyclase